MHALLMDMGLEISRQQFISNPEKPIRLWRHEDIYRFFNNDKATVEAVRCVSLDMSKMKMIKWRSSDFQKMHNLIFLRIYKSDQRRKPSKLNLFGHLDYLPEELRFFRWEEYPLPYVPLHFCAENLVILGTPNSNIRQLGNGTQHFPNLKRMDVQYSKDLTAIPDLCHTPKIEKLCLDGCVSLAHIHYSSDVSGRNVTLYIQDSRPLEMDIEGIFRMEGLSPSGFEIVRSYSLDGCDNLSMKVEVRGKIMSGVGFKHVEENAELRQRLECLLPYVKRVEWSESAIDDFNQHYNYHLHYTDPFYSLATDNDLPLTTQVAAMATTMATTTTSTEYYDSNNSVTLTRYHSSITPKELMNYREPLNKNIPRDLILKAFYYGYSRQCGRTSRSSVTGWKNLSP
ncbi:disease resistance protein RPS6-like [Neltuma alba]|uniref:disease resistance protein RPS6-like n=1 Tax=Neltuma alba TaxID=207710 RepID=UPI0010A4B8DE|nr:disease resistance protein RPS6-like [Prosopis alba]